MKKINYVSTETVSPDKLYEKEIDIKKLFKIIKKRFWIVILFIVIFTFLGGIYSYKFTQPLFQSSARLILQGANPDQVNTYNVIIKDPSILDKVIDELNLSTTPELLSGQISLVTNSQVVTVFVTGSSPVLTSSIANTLINTFKQEIPKITGYDGVIILSEAKIQDNMRPINQGHIKVIMISSIIGLALGLGFVFFVNSLDDTFNSESEIELLLDLPVLGSVSRVRRIKAEKKSNQSLSVRGESYGPK